MSAKHPGSLELREVREGEVGRIEARGEIDLGTSPSLDAALARAQRSDARQIVLDLKGVELIDSTGLLVLLSAAQRSAKEPARLGMLFGGGRIAERIRLTGIDKAIRLLD
jgi:anti-sigma B factor antagonist